MGCFSDSVDDLCPFKMYEVVGATIKISYLLRCLLKNNKKFRDIFYNHEILRKECIDVYGHYDAKLLVKIMNINILDASHLTKIINIKTIISDILIKICHGNGIANDNENTVDLGENNIDKILELKTFSVINQSEYRRDEDNKPRELYSSNSYVDEYNKKIMERNKKEDMIIIGKVTKRMDVETNTKHQLTSFIPIAIKDVEKCFKEIGLRAELSLYYIPVYRNGDEEYDDYDAVDFESHYK